MKHSLLKITLFLALSIGCVQHEVQADTKVLRNISITVSKGLSDETISLENGKDLVIEGFQVQRYAIPNDPEYELKLTINYVADKEGYRAKYTLILQDSADDKRLSPSSLKSVAG